MYKIIIIGNKNVGKSSLFNLLIKSKHAINIEESGYTRDCNTIITKIENKIYEITDTAGLGNEKTELDYKTLKNTWKNIKESNLIIFMTDINNINFSFNKNIIKFINKLNQKKIFIMNKIDLIKYEDLLKYKKKYNILISVKKNIGIQNLIKQIDSIFIQNKLLKIKKKEFKISIFGKPNVGKSLLTNRITKLDKTIVHNLSGTTKDNIKINFLEKNKNFSIFDTPGIKNKIKNKLEFLYKNSKIKNKVDLSIFTLNINENPKNIFMKIKNLNILCFNKCDFINKKKLIAIENKIKNKKINNFVFTSAKYNFGILNLKNKVFNIKKNTEIKISKLKFNNIKKDINQNIKNIEIKKIKIYKYLPLIIFIYIKNKKNLFDNKKKYIMSIIIHQLNLNNFTFKLKFK